MRKLFLLFQMLAACLASLAEAGSGLIVRVEAFKAPSTGTEFLVIWNERREMFCVSEPADSVRFVVQPDSLSQQYSWGDGTTTFKLHQATLKVIQQELDVSELCD